MTKHFVHAQAHIVALALKRVPADLREATCAEAIEMLKQEEYSDSLLSRIAEIPLAELERL